MKAVRSVATALLLAACSSDATSPRSLRVTPDESPSDPSSPTSPTPPSDAGGATDVDLDPPIVDVRSEGAHGDGTTDDTNAIRDALTKGVALGRLVVFPAGRYLVTKVVPVSLTAGASLAIEGRGGATIVGTAPEPAPETELGVLDITGPSNAGASARLAISHLTFELARTARGQLDGLRADRLGDVELDDVKVSGASRWGIALVRAGTGRVVGCNASNNRYGGLGLDASANVTVDGGTFSDNGTTAPVDGYGISCMSSVIGPCTDVTITRTAADRNKRKGIDVHSGHRILIDDNHVTGFESSGIYAVNEDPGKDVKDVTIKNNVVDGAGAAHYVYGIEVGAFSGLATDSGTFTIQGNTIKNTSFTTSSAIMLRNPASPGKPTTRVTIDKNTIVNGAAPDAYVIRGDNYAVPISEIVVKDNSVAASQASVGIGLLRAQSTTVTGNTISIASGSVAYGILVSAPAVASIANNALLGGATYGVPIASSAGQVLRSNTLKGAPLPNVN